MTPALLAFLAGLLTTASPCVLPVLPMVLGSGTQKSRFAPALMILGLMSSFVFFGVLLARLGAGFPTEILRQGSAVLLIVSGVFLLWTRAQDWLSLKLSAVAGRAAEVSRVVESGFAGPILVGALLGLVWSPCVGPTLGSAIALAAHQTELSAAIFLMSVYAMGAGLPMLAIAYGARELFRRHRGRFLSFSEKGKVIFGVIIILTGLAVLGGLDKHIESWLLSMGPESWIEILTKY